MNKKTQSQSIGEVFRISWGVILLISVIYLFYSVIIPNITEYSLTLGVRNINSNLNLILSKIINLDSYELIEDEIDFSYSFPDNLEGNSYSIYLDNDEICTIINAFSIKECKEIVFPHEGISLSGLYLSGGTFNINFVIDSEDKILTFTN